MTALPGRTASGDRNDSPGEGHEGLLGDTVVYFTMTTHAGRKLDLRSVTQRLLSREVAYAASWPSTEGVRVTPSMRKFAASVNRAENLGEDTRAAIENPTLNSAVNFALKHPVLASKAVQGRFKNNAEDDQEGVDFDDYDASINQAREVIIETQKIAALVREMDAGLFSGPSRDNDSFVRLDLPTSTIDISIPGREDKVTAAVEVRLLLHESGAVQMTINMPLLTETKFSQLTYLSRSDYESISRAEIPESILRGYREVSLPGAWMQDTYFNLRYREVEFSEQVSIMTMFDLYMQAVGETLKIHARGTWSVHATLISSAGECCTHLKDWKSFHANEIAKLASRYSSDMSINVAQFPNKDFSLHPDTILHLNMGSTTSITLDEALPSGVDQLWTVLLVEHALLQYARLQRLEDEVGTRNLYGPRLQKLYRESIDLFTDMRQREVRYGSARAIAGHLLSELGGLEIRKTVETALNLAAQADATRSATRQSRWSAWLAGVGAALASLVAIPPLNQVLRSVQEVEAETALATVLTPLRFAASLSDWGAWVVVAGAWVVVALAFMLGSTIRVVRQWRANRWRSFWGGHGHRLPNGFEFKLDLRDSFRRPPENE